MTTTRQPHAVDRLVPMVHVVDVDRSCAFYAMLGFAVKNRIQSAGVTNWAWLESGGASLMLARADGPVDAAQQAILLYLYSGDVRALRTSLLASGVPDGGEFRGGPLPTTNLAAVFTVTSPFYMQKGELRVHDPDGYCLLIGHTG